MPDSYWINRIIPTSRADAHGCTVITWALFGNDEDGIYGGAEPSFMAFLKWWLRNPFHNMSFHVLAWKRETSFVVFEAPPFRGLYVRDPMNWVSDGNQVQFTLLPLFFSWRVAEWEGYCGWRQAGELGLSLRRHG